MPELPEVETMVRGIRQHVTGRKIRGFRDCGCRCKPLSLRPDLPELTRRMTGNTISEVRRLGKRVVLDLQDGASLAIEPRMTGLMVLADPPDVEHLRLEWEFAGRGEFDRLWFWDRRGLGTVRLFERGELESALAGSLGPDALTAPLTHWLGFCKRTSRPIKVVLLDQTCLAGIGNLYASEILHVAKVGPARPANQLTAREIGRLHQAAQDVLNDAIRHEGSTLGDGTYRNALNKAGGYQNVHRVYMKAGQPCATCRKTAIERIVQAQRSTFYCPRCQPPKDR
ncbi:bifunctional DNA-formamidopyrimidine glycosylase/DNA-(apurinic or apyrimidinic site) lyase [Planctellipticum variicoloris]|uniref:bifunctional DNA-formamidopyrimidine glycosylase/DNA-(apurinic or apyrimidinic site) lyase n=1 Tax=Planctellipticum variicoloris TaxID=3064265 RepID=UPI003013F60C|nr:bifunctional DNA-formamidopyrimidine glycosylase/DNA-(apurinic or apyrimidinic site) lyase [Planctomycetaceae bacterium SH412]